mmetsp:Transcript_22671/g.51836  ORF Transcript_22671/g.51836 Transcript_22671/m.51836 type:complete len:151 (+) Transcript_22671:68-520(+)
MMRAAAIAVVAALFGAELVSAAAFRQHEQAALQNQTSSGKMVASAAKQPLNSTAKAQAATQRFMEVKLGPFATAAEACDYCFGSYTKTGDAPAGPVAPACVCMAYPEGTDFTMFCATPTSAAGFVADKGGCRCKARDMEKMAATTCQPIS